MLTCGIDIGSSTIKAAIFDGERVICTAVVKSGSHPTDHAQQTLRAMLEANGISRDDLAGVLATGYGRNYFKEADAVSSEIICHAAGADHMLPGVRTVIDIGGQDSKIISLDELGRVRTFAMNDRCAAGTGKFIEMVSLMLDIPLDRMAEESTGGEDECEISSMCAVFAESEIIGLTQSGTQVDVVLRGVFRAIAKRVLSMAGKVGVMPEIAFTGGVALNSGIARAIERETGINLRIPPDPQSIGAVGAAIIAGRRLKAACGIRT